jgi:hypothetical protein
LIAARNGSTVTLMRRRSASRSLVVLLAVLALGTAAAPDRSAAVTIVECNGARPTNPDPDSTQYEIGENKAVQTVLGIMCLPADHTVSSSDVDWGDGTSSPPLITYVEANGGTRQAWITGAGAHSYPRATCPRGFCHSTFTVSATVTDDQTGEGFPLRARIEVVPVLDVITLAPVRAHAHRLFRGQVATVHTGGFRFLHEMSARLNWDDGTSSRARVSGGGRDYTFRASHLWRAPGTYNVALVVRDGFTGERTLRYLRAHVAEH